MLSTRIVGNLSTKDIEAVIKILAADTPKEREHRGGGSSSKACAYMKLWCESTWYHNHLWHYQSHHDTLYHDMASKKYKQAVKEKPASVMNDTD